MSETDVFCSCVRGPQVHAHASTINSLICTTLALHHFIILGCRAYGESSGTKFLQTGNL